MTKSFVIDTTLDKIKFEELKLILDGKLLDAKMNKQDHSMSITDSYNGGGLVKTTYTYTFSDPA